MEGPAQRARESRCSATGRTRPVVHEVPQRARHNERQSAGRREQYEVKHVRPLRQITSPPVGPGRCPRPRSPSRPRRGARARLLMVRSARRECAPRTTTLGRRRVLPPRNRPQPAPAPRPCAGVESVGVSLRQRVEVALDPVADAHEPEKDVLGVLQTATSTQRGRRSPAVRQDSDVPSAAKVGRSAEVARSCVRGSTPPASAPRD
jgi:hypothetical protein